MPIWTDNESGEGALAKGSAKASDHNLLSHATWMLAAQLGLSIWFERVPTKLNVADLPSRDDFGLLVQLGAEWKEPVVPPGIHQPELWADPELLPEVRSLLRADTT